MVFFLSKKFHTQYYTLRFILKFNHLVLPTYSFVQNLRLMNRTSQ